MASYKYEVVGADGKPKTGTIEAMNMEVASAELKSGGNTIVSIARANAFNNYFCIYSCMHSWLRHPYHPYESKQAKQPACTRSVPFGRHIHRRTLGQPFLDLVSWHDGHLLKHGRNCYVWHN